MSREFIGSERIAYFTVEIALRPDIPRYSGGLGVLAGDTVRSAADLAENSPADREFTHYLYGGDETGVSCED